MKTLKKLLIIAATLVLFCVISVAASAETYGDLTYIVLDGKVKITNCNESAAEIEIPEKINGYPVTSIGGYAFDDCDGLTSITIPDSVTSIGAYAFYNCKGLASVTIPDSVTSIGESAFYNCKGLTSVTIPDSVTSIGSGAFCDCEGLTSVTIPDSVTSIGNYAFCNCKGLTSVTIGESVTTIGESAFSDCTGLTKINWNAKSVSDFDSYKIGDLNCSIKVFYNAGAYGTGIEVIFGDKVERIPAYLFYSYRDTESEWPQVTSVTIGNSVTSIGNYAFSDCYGLTSITIPDSVTSIGSGAFYGTGYYNNEQNWENDVLYINNHLIIAKDTVSEDYKIKQGTKTIAASAFDDCEGLTSVTIPDSVTSIGSGAFSGLYELKRVYITDIAAWCNIDFGDDSSNPIYYAEELYVNNKLLTELVIPDSVTSIGNYAFYNCEDLTSIKIPDSVKSIGKYAFSSCDGLTSVTIGNSVTSFGNYAFAYCTGLTSIKIPDSVKSIGTGAFYDTGYYNNEQNWENDVLYINNHLIDAKNTVSGNYKIKQGTKTICGFAFSDCKNITSIIIPDSVKSIGSGAFRDCYGLKSITIPDSITSIGDYTFYNCKCLTSVTIPNSVTTIGDWAFYDNYDTMHAIVYFIGTEEEWNNITIGHGNYRLNWVVFKPAFVLGDVNGDNQITAEDARLALRLSAGLETLEKLNVTVDVVDYNKDGQITAEDARRILRKSAGLE